MKIALLIGYYDSRYRYQEVCIAEALAAMGHDIQVITSTGRNPSVREFGSGGSPSDYDVSSKYKVKRLRPTFEWRSIVIVRGVQRELDSQRFDSVLVVAPGQLFHISAMLALNRMHRYQNARIAVLYGDNDDQYLALRPVWRSIKRAAFYCTKGLLYWITNRPADCIFGYTNNTIKLIGNLRPGTPVQLLPLCVEKDIFQFKMDDRIQCRAEIGVSENELLVICAGKVSESKRINDVLRAVLGMPHESKLRILIVGMGKTKYCENLRESFSRCGPADQKGPIFVSFVSSAQLRRYLSAADIGIWYRQPAITIQQALVNGVYCILPKSDTTNHLLHSEVMGAYISPGSYCDLVDALRYLVNQRDGLFSDKARLQRVDLSSRFASENVARQIITELMPTG